MSYIVPGATDFLALSLDDRYQYLTAASVTTWKDWINADIDGDGIIDQAWRQNDTYTAIKTGSNFEDFPYWASMEDDNANDFHSAWKRTSNITRFDRYGHPVEERGLDGTYTSSLYGYDDALPVAIAKNAKEEEIYYDGFESGDFDGQKWGWYYHLGPDGTSSREITTEEAHTGNYSLKFIKNDDIWNGVYFSSGNYVQVTPGKKYTISSWYKCTGDRYGYINWYDQTNLQSHIKTQIGTDEWEYIEFTIEAPAGCTDLQVYLYGYLGSSDTPIYYDDIRVFPADAQMSTFAYDPLTWQVTSITDANNISTYYEYDAAGRLIAVKDQDGKVLSTNNYQYGRDN